MLRHLLRKLIPTVALAFAGAGVSVGQTVLTPGDLAMVGVNANNSCIASTNDEVSFVCFKTITTNTKFIITDCGYQTQNAGLWGDNEGVVQLWYTGSAPILAGTVITIRQAGSVSVVSPAGTWTITVISGSFDLNSTGDQLFVFQPGPVGPFWNNPGGTNNAFFTNCTLLYAFNTKATWTPFTYTGAGSCPGTGTCDSDLPPGSVCFSMAPTAASNFVKFTDLVAGGAFATRTQRQWIIDLDNSANWSTYATCALYNSGVPVYAAGYSLPITVATFTNGLWTGAKTQDWFDCRNWDDAEVPTAASNVIINQTRIQNCQVGISLLTPTTAQCATLQVTSSASTISPQLAINSGRQLVVTGATTINRTVAGTAIGITVGNGGFTAGSLTMQGNVSGSLNGTFRNLVSTNSAQINGDVLINNGGRLDLTGGTLSLTGNFRSMDATAGVAAFSEAGSVVSFNGAGPQTILSNGFQEEFDTLRVSKSGSDLSLSAPVLVKAKLDLLNRRVFSTATNLMSLAAAATTTNASNSSFVSGPMRKFGTANFTFPVGKGTNYRPASLTTITGAATDAFTAEYFSTTAPGTPWVLGLFPGTLAATLDHISDCEYWQIDRSNGTPNAFVTLSWDAATSCGVTLMADLRVARYDGAVWRDRGNGGTTGTLLAGTAISSASQTAFGPWTLASTSGQNPLPIELMYFTAVPHGDVVNLEWATASELDNDRFVVERSVDGFNFQPVLTRSGAGNSTSVIEYQDVDRSPLPGLSYYRLGQIDLDGTTTWSDLVPVEFNASGTRPLTVLYGTDELIAVHAFGAGATFEVLDPLGRVVHGGTSGEAGRTPLQLSNLARGTYVLRLFNGNRSESTQFVR